MKPIAAPVIILHGPTQAGKSWQATHLAERHGYIYISSGDLLRGTRDPKILAHIGSGQLARSEDVERLVHAALVAAPSDRLVVLDGFPRMLGEFHNLERLLAELGRPIKRVLEVYIPPEESHARVDHRARHDDDHRAVERKWRWYTTDTKQVLDYCRQQGWLRVVDGVGDRQVVAARVEAVL